MNWDTLRGSWDQWKGAFQRQWGKLTNDDLQAVGGERARLVGILEERYGQARESIEREVDTFLHNLR